MIVKTHLLKGFALDWALAKALGAKKIIYSYKGVWVEDEGFKVGDDSRGWIHHTDPAVCLELTEQYKIDVTWGTSGKAFVQMSGSDQDQWCGGKTLAEAVARCVVAMRLGDEVDVPGELCGEQA